MTMPIVAKVPLWETDETTDDLNVWGGSDEFGLYNQPTKVETAHDLLILGCALYRLTKAKPDKYKSYSLTTDHKSLSGEVKVEDIQLANTIREYYTHTLLLFKIQVGKLSKYKEDLKTFLETSYDTLNGKYSTPDRYVGMCQRLPYFYEYDTTQVSFFDQGMKVVGPDQTEEIKELTYIGKLNTATKKARGKLEYWFKDIRGNRVVIEMDTSNQLLPVFSLILDKPIRIEAVFKKRIHYSAEYYVTFRNWKLVI